MWTAKAAFWLAAAIAAYVYVGYPALLALWARLGGRVVKRANPDDPLPALSIVVAVRDERVHLAARLENLLMLEYPAERQIIVVSDGSTDGTAQVAASFAPHVEVIAQPPRGKATALNIAVARARHDIVVFADARQRFAPDALRQLAGNFADPEVGAVSGELVLDGETRGAPAGESTIGKEVGLYWRYEKWLRRHESSVGSTIGVTGAIYAMRRACWRPLPPETILDDVLAPMRTVLAGKRVVFDSSAVAFDHASPNAAAESRRKVRTLAGNYQLMRLEPRVLLPFVNPVWLQFLSHKVGRLIVPYALVACFVSSAVLVGRGWMYTTAFVSLTLIALLAVYGAVLEAAARQPVRRLQPHPRSGVPEQEPTRAKRIVNA